MVIRSHRDRFWFRLTPHRRRVPRYPLNPTASSLIAERVPISLSGWLFRMSRDRPNRTGLGRRAIRLGQRRSRRRRQLRLRMALKVPCRLFLPRRDGIHDGPLR
ncbi:hypothetical protein [Paraburkholderia dinghuensis]|uniref:Uncharacterized protein n=1 Tax=Paraburkholderia dinghuensis TaxID=2305225 RepID=A0A3N6PSN5_9BURK|nr:hypothetical protein [Paraburkholderia dinghuensis]RQH05010.1 hypothetical protein D1Y85_16505 [Paraburkholderia dinghuensis]